jgi:hypothetical protein
MDSETDLLITKIHKNGYWRVVIAPTRYERRRIPSLQRCRDIVEASAVHLRGWDYPHVNQGNLRNRESWVESWVDWQYGHLEYWRFYQSGQFVHHFAMREDYEESSSQLRGLDFLNTLFSMTEIFEFAARLAAKDVLKPGATMAITLHGTNDRRVISWDRGRYVRDSAAIDPEIKFEEEFSAQMLLINASHLAVDATEYVLDRFNSTISAGLLLEEQSKFLERRLDSRAPNHESSV